MKDMSEEDLNFWWYNLDLDDLLKYFVPFTSDYNEFLDALDDDWEKKSLQAKEELYWSFKSATDE